MIREAIGPLLENAIKRNRGKVSELLEIIDNKIKISEEYKGANK